VRQARGRHTAVVDLRGVRRTVVRVKIAVTYTDGTTRTSTRRYRTCRTRLAPSNDLGSRRAL
jgi:hypothetical protein